MPSVLVVDDNINIRKLMVETLNDLGFANVQEAANGRQALEMSKKSLPDIITLDWNMPEMNGLEYLTALRNLPGGDKPCVIFCSTEGRADKMKMVLAAGANEYITKPFSEDIVRQKLVKLGLI